MVRMEQEIELKVLEEKLRCLEIEIDKYKKIIVMQQECIFNKTSLESFQKCCHCDKVFVNVSFLKSHTRRRHGIFPSENIETKDEKPAFVDQDTQTCIQIKTSEDLSFSTTFDLIRSRSWPNLRASISISNESEWEKGRKKKKSLKGRMFVIRKKINQNFKNMLNRK